MPNLNFSPTQRHSVLRTSRYTYRSDNRYLPIVKTVVHRYIKTVLQIQICRYMYVAISAVKGRLECRLTYCTIPYLRSI